MIAKTEKARKDQKRLLSRKFGGRGHLAGVGPVEGDAVGRYALRFVHEVTHQLHPLDEHFCAHWRMEHLQRHKVSHRQDSTGMSQKSAAWQPLAVQFHALDQHFALTGRQPA